MQILRPPLGGSPSAVPEEPQRGHAIEAVGHAHCGRHHSLSLGARLHRSGEGQQSTKKHACGFFFLSALDCDVTVSSFQLPVSSSYILDFPAMLEYNLEL